MAAISTGIQHFRDDQPVIRIYNADMSVGGIVGPDPTADPIAFPINTPVKTTTNSELIQKLTLDGDLRDAVNGIAAQLIGTETAGRIVIVRTALGANIDETIANIVGDPNLGTGMFALKRAGVDLALIPRLVSFCGYTKYFIRTGGSTNVSSFPKAGGNVGTGALTLAGPAYGASAKHGIYRVRCSGGARGATSAAKAGGNTGNGALGTLTADATAPVGPWRVVCGLPAVNGGSFTVIRPDNSVDGIAVVGSAYNGGINFTISDGATDFIVGDEFVVTVVNAVPANGGVFAVTDPDGFPLADATVGVAYNGAHVKFTIADGVTDFVLGDGFDITVAITNPTAHANPILAAAPTLIEELKAHVVADGPTTNAQDYQDWLETISSPRIIAGPACNVLVPNSVGAEVERAASSRIIGLAMRIDSLSGGRPFRSWANRPIYGITGVSRNIPMSLTISACEGQDLLRAKGSIIVKGEAGIESAVADGGFMYWGFDTMAPDGDAYRFYHISRGRDWIELGQVVAFRPFLGTQNITLPVVMAGAETLRAQLSIAKSREELIDFEIGYKKADNPGATLIDGDLVWRFKAEEPPALRRIFIHSGRMPEALDALSATIETQVGRLLN